MSLPSRPDDPDDPLALPPADDDERAEAEWLLAREVDPAAAPPSPDVAQAYARLEGLLADLPAGEDVPDRPDWQDAVFAQMRAEAPKEAAAPATKTSVTASTDARTGAGDFAGELKAAPAAARARQRWFRNAGFGGVLVAAAAMAVLYIGKQKAPGPDNDLDELALSLLATGGATRGDREARLGDTWRLRFPANTTAELRVFLDGKPVLQCPGASCPSGKVWDVSVPLKAYGKYRAVLARRRTGLPASASLEDFLDAVPRAERKGDHQLPVQ